MKEVKVSEVLKAGHSASNEVVAHTASYMNEATMVIKLDDELKKRGLSQKKLAEMTGIRISTISDIINGKGTGYNKMQLIAIMVALRLTKLSDIIEIRLPIELEEKYSLESSKWKETKELPDGVYDMFKENVLKKAGL